MRLFFCFMTRLPPGSTLFPYTTLFRSCSLSLLSASFFDERNNTLSSERENYQKILDFIQGSLQTLDRKSTRLNSSHVAISYAVFCLRKKKKQGNTDDAVQEKRNFKDVF